MSITKLTLNCPPCDISATSRIADDSARAIATERASLEANIRRITQCEHELVFNHRTTDEPLPV